MTEGSDTPPASCPNCGWPSQGRYCSNCGERFLTDHDFSLRHFFLEALPRELLDIDGKFLYTLKTLLLRPGRLAADYVAGRRQQYLEPLRFYVIAFLLHATLVAVLGGHGHSFLQTIRDNDPGNVLSRLVAARHGVDWNDPELRDSLSERQRWCSEIGTMLVFLGIAALQKIVFLRTRRRYLEHLCLALNVVSFFIVTMVLVEAVLGIFARDHFALYDAYAQQAIGMSLLPIYWFVAIRNFYKVRVPAAVFGTISIWLGNVLIAWCLNLLVLAMLIATA